MNTSDPQSETMLPISGAKVGGNPLSATIAGLGAAAVGASVWAAIAYYADYELGFVAWGIGVAVGFAIARIAGASGMPAQAIAVICALLGIAGGKYAAFYAFIKDEINAEYSGDEAGEILSELTMFSMETMQLFASSFSEMVSPFDALWVILAVGSAWGMTKPTE